MASKLHQSTVDGGRHDPCPDESVKNRGQTTLSQAQTLKFRTLAAVDRAVCPFFFTLDARLPAQASIRIDPEQPGLRDAFGERSLIERQVGSVRLFHPAAVFASVFF